jgi:xanthosine utilization system XapX-like protein
MTHPAAPLPPPVEPPGPPTGPASRPYGPDALIALAIGLVFLYLGAPLLTWAAHGFAGNPFGLVWSDGHPDAGQAVPYFAVEQGAAWRDVGLVATGVALLAEAALLYAAALRPFSARRLLRIMLAAALAGLAANALSAAMQVRSGFTAPTYAVLGAVVCLFSAVAAWQRRAAD